MRADIRSADPQQLGIHIAAVHNSKIPFFCPEKGILIIYHLIRFDMTTFHQWIASARSMIRCGTLLVGVLMLATTTYAQQLQSTDNSGMGILQIRSQAIGQSLRLTMPMLIPGDIVKGWRTYAGFSWTNVWANDYSFVLDYEMLDILAGVGYGFNDRWGLAAIVDNRSYFGGAMDSLIEEFHNEFSIDQDGRDKAPRGRSVALRKDPVTGQTDEISAGDMNNTGLSLLVNCNLFQGSATWPSVNVYGVVRHALSPAKVFSRTGGLDWGLGAGLSKRWYDRWYTYIVLGYTIYQDRGKTTTGDVEFEDRQISGLGALAWQYSPDVTLIAQYLYTSTGIKNIISLNQPSHEVHLGCKWHVGSSYTLEAAIIENIITMDNSPDFGLHLGVSVGI